jgi:transposase
MKRLAVVQHLSAAEARARYRACRPAVERTWWHAVWLLLRTDRPHTPAQVGEVVGLSAVAVRHLLARWNAHGPDGLADRRRGNGAAPRLPAERWAALGRAVRRRPPDGGLWSGPKVAAYARRWGVRVSAWTGWAWRRRLGLTPQVPRPSHPQAADAPARRRWNNTCGDGSPG